MLLNLKKNLSYAFDVLCMYFLLNRGNSAPKTRNTARKLKMLYYSEIIRIYKSELYIISLCSSFKTLILFYQNIQKQLNHEFYY